jgi:hypothetical protein
MKCPPLNGRWERNHSFNLEDRGKIFFRIVGISTEQYKYTGSQLMRRGTEEVRQRSPGNHFGFVLDITAWLIIRLLLIY